MSVQLKEGLVSASSPSSSWNHRLNNHTHNNPFPLHETSKIEESDEDLFRVPDMEATAGAGAECGGGGGGGAVASKANAKPAASLSNVTVTTDSQFQSGKRRRGRNPADKECRRLKRLLRNRVSAQQARERKKLYVNELEARAKELQDKNSKLEERISTIVNENTMLRKVLMNTRPKVDESSEPKQD